MDKQKIEMLQQKLFIEMKVGAILYKKENRLSLLQIKKQLNDNRYSDEFFKSVLKKLVSHGIITASFVNDNILLYQITDFGQYFFEKLLLENGNIQEYVDSIGEAD